MKIQSIILASMALFAVSCNSGTEKTDKAATNSDIQYVSTSLPKPLRAMRTIG